MLKRANTHPDPDDTCCTFVPVEQRRVLDALVERRLARILDARAYGSFGCVAYLVELHPDLLIEEV